MTFKHPNLQTAYYYQVADESGTGPPPPAPGPIQLQSSSQYNSGGGRGYYLYEHHGGPQHHGLSDRGYEYRSSASSLYPRDRDRPVRKDYAIGYTSAAAASAAAATAATGISSGSRRIR